MNQKFKESLQLQNQLNIETAGPNWTSGISKDNREINWRRALYMELAEALDSLNWKHWKSIDAPENIDNLKIELVDSWHFIQSLLIEERGIKQAETYLNIQFQKYLNEPTFSQRNLIQKIEDLIKKTINKEDVVLDFFILIQSITDFGIKEVQALYIGKNCLNKFRLNNGYKEGTYIKIWKEKEDNVFMQNLLKDNPDLTYDELYNLLNKQYKVITKKGD